MFNNVMARAYSHTARLAAQMRSRVPRPRNELLLPDGSDARAMRLLPLLATCREFNIPVEPQMTKLEVIARIEDWKKKCPDIPKS